MITIIDYGAGNLKSIFNMLTRIGYESVITSNPNQIIKSKKIILPGNGSYDYCMKNLRKSNLIDLLKEKAIIEKIPILGICVGAQILGHSSEEGVENGLGWIDMEVKKIPEFTGLRIPNMGWRNVIKSQDHFLLNSLTEDSRFYFAHSYFMSPNNLEDTLLTSNYGHEFSAAVINSNIVGVQFHPEKSHKFGKSLIGAFAEWKI